jgi:hypothetical protein
MCLTWPLLKNILHCRAGSAFYKQIVQDFDVEIYYVCKGEEGQQNTQKYINTYNKGQPNKQNVMDSSINTGLLNDKEHKNLVQN